MTQLIVTILG